MKHLIIRVSVASALAAAACWQIGCQNEEGPQSTPLLAEARADETNFSPVKARNPYKEVEKNLLERTVYESAGPGGTRIELRDLFVSPGAMVEKVSLPGPAILQVLSGEGKMTTAEKATELTVGTTLTLGQDTSCALESRGITPLVLRAHIVVP
ncbi:MAG TPA: hypothetical protein VN087_13745 [Verrucomicrobiae bacterium]|jgi:hypothetical protein|nr:hypothetical protein [Verrucomicrobiae bacterium]